MSCDEVVAYLTVYYGCNADFLSTIYSIQQPVNELAFQKCGEEREFQRSKGNHDVVLILSGYRESED